MTHDKRKYFGVQPHICTKCHRRYEFNTDNHGVLLMRCECSSRWQLAQPAKRLSWQALAAQKRGRPRQIKTERSLRG